jgi:hypothetical protein
MKSLPCAEHREGFSPFRFCPRISCLRGQDSRGGKENKQDSNGVASASKGGTGTEINRAPHELVMCGQKVPKVFTHE